MKILPRIIFVLIILCISAMQINAQIISGEPPTVSIESIEGYTLSSAALSTLNQNLQNQITAAWNQLMIDANLELAKYGNPEDLAKGFANANAYASRAATMQGFQDYSLFAVMSGVMFGVQAPSFDIDKDRIKSMRQEIKDEGDVYLGISTGLAFINAGLNSGFIYPGLYINLVYGYYSLNGKDIDSDLEGFTYKTSLYGIGINKTIFWPHNIIPGLMRWRGISIGTGFYYSKSETDIEILMDLDTEPVTTSIPGYPGENVSFVLQLDPSLKLEIENTTMTIPLDITTSWQLLWVLNFNLGAGVDFTYGSSDIGIKAAGDITTNITDDPDITANVEPGYVAMQGGVKGVKPSLLNYRITTGLGFNFSILKIDIPIAVYLDSGFSAGLTAGIVW